MSTSVNVHEVVKVSVRREPGYGWTTFVFTGEKGRLLEVTAFSAKRLVIEGAEFANFVAEHEGSEA